ncbi:MFS transporter [Arthrobacter sp. Sa2BUA2]|uniref:MFS transporter n=1 Tax=Arthrobacter pullicola TaxID=2762224 RepID=A0ABR8YJD4_9MICC|nr:MFS transporter [Arthrobacter pullicola]MBD8044325.1 MFS transporter [Arthrobacter pullicola]
MTRDYEPEQRSPAASGTQPDISSVRPNVPTAQPEATAPPEPLASPASAPPPLSQGRYGRIFEIAGKAFFPVAFLARLPLAMLTIGALTLITSITGSYAQGGFAAGAVGLGSAVGGPLLGYLADRVGQRPLLLGAAVVNPLMILTVLFTAAQLPAGGPLPAVLAAAFAMGATGAQVGPLARVRWMAMTSRDRSGRELGTALSYESMADELSFVLGPALVGLLAAAVAPWLPLVLAAVISGTMVTAFALHRSAETVVPAGRRRTDRNRAKARAAGADRPSPAGIWRTWAVLALPILGMVAMGTFFGATQASLTAFGGTFGIADAAGLLYAVMGISSAVAALSVAFWPERLSQSVRWVLSALAMTGAALMLLLPAGIPEMLVVLFVLGIPVGPTMVSIFGIGAQLAPQNLMGTVMTLLASGTVAGTAVGSALAGPLAQEYGHSAAFWVSSGAAGALLVLGVASAVAVRRLKKPQA